VKKNTHYIYLTLLSFDSVFKTQIISWLNLYRQQGVDFTIVKAYPVSQISGIRQHIRQIREIRSAYKGRVRILYVFPGETALGSVINAMIISLIVLRPFTINGRYLIQTRNKSFGRSLGIVRSLIGFALHVIYDCRAASAEEYRYLSTQRGHYQEEKYSRTLNEEVRMLAVADSVFYVSNELKKYFSGKTPGLDPKPSLIYPCNTDNTRFYFSAEERDSIRYKLGLGDRLVLCYSGGMDFAWHKPDAVLAFFNRMREADPRIFLLVLSRDTDSVKKVLEAHNIDTKDYLALSLENHEVRPHLAASDLGLLFRDNAIMNNVASPTKFAEYLLCGLPVAISPGVGDFSKFVLDHDCGIVIDSPEQCDNLFIISNMETWALHEPKQRFSELGNRYFSKQSLLPEILGMYDRT